MAVMYALPGHVFEARRLCHARAHLRAPVPYRPGSRGTARRLRATSALVKDVIRALATDTVCWRDDVWVVDPTPMECGRSRETVPMLRAGRMGTVRLEHKKGPAGNPAGPF
jgi:hypothetical protein